MPFSFQDLVNFIMAVMMFLASQIPLPPWLVPPVDLPTIPDIPAIPGIPTIPEIPNVSVVPTVEGPTSLPLQSASRAEGAVEVAKPWSPAPRPTIAVPSTGLSKVADVPASLGARAVTGEAGERIVNPSGLPRWPGEERPASRRRLLRRNSTNTTEIETEQVAPPAPAASPLPLALLGVGLLVGGIYLRHRRRHIQSWDIR